MLAAAYAGGIVQNHPFLDGNKRASLLATVTFLALNGLEPTFTDEDAAVWWLSLAAGALSETELAQLLRTRTMKAP